MDIRTERTNETSLINKMPELSIKAKEISIAEMEAPIKVSIDSSLRLKILDQCGMACTFCHNEGTPVTADNKGRSPSEFISEGKSSRVSIYLSTNGASFVNGMVKCDETFTEALDTVKATTPYDEIHLTGGEPTLHPQLPEIVSLLKKRNLTTKITSNGERFFAIAERLKEAGLDKVVFSIFGTTPEELAAVQGKKYANPRFAELKLNALERSIVSAHEVGIAASANIVLPSVSHIDRVAGVIEKYGDLCKIRVLNSLDDGGESYAAVYELLARLDAKPIRVNLTAGASGMSIDYMLPDGKEIGFKQIRRSYLSTACDGCSLKDDGCEEGYYGVRMYVDTEQQYHVGVCIQRMDMTKPVQEFANGNLPEAIQRHRIDEYNKIINTI